MMTEKFDQGVQKVTSGMMPGFAVLGSVLASNLSNIYLDSQLEVKNYFVLSVGEVSFKGKTYPVSVGVFNHVFVYEPTEEEMRRILEDLR